MYNFFPPSATLQEMLLRRGAVPRLVAILLRFPEKEVLEEACLQALCNLSGMGVAEEAGMVWERGASVRPGESVFHGVSPHTCGFASSVTLVCVSQWAPGHYAVNIEVFQRCSSSFWSLHGNKRTARWFPFSSLGSCSNLYRVIKFSTRNVPRTRSLRTRVFHTFLWQFRYFSMVAPHLQLFIHTKKIRTMFTHHKLAGTFEHIQSVNASKHLLSFPLLLKIELMTTCSKKKPVAAHFRDEIQLHCYFFMQYWIK